MSGWPFRFGFSLSAAEIFENIDSRAIDEPVTGSEAFREVALRLESNYDGNAGRIQLLLWCFRLAIVFRVLEVGAWIAAFSSA